MRAVSVAKPDGYTILMGLVSISTIPVADEVLGRPASFKLSQFTPIARITADPTVLAVRADSPWKTYKEFMDYVKANPNKINFGSSGNYGTMHVPMEMLKLETGTKMTPRAIQRRGSRCGWPARRRDSGAVDWPVFDWWSRQKPARFVCWPTGGPPSWSQCPMSPA